MGINAKQNIPSWIVAVRSGTLEIIQNAGQAPIPDEVWITLYRNLYKRYRRGHTGQVTVASRIVDFPKEPGAQENVRVTLSA